MSKFKKRIPIASKDERETCFPARVPPAREACFPSATRPDLGEEDTP